MSSALICAVNMTGLGFCIIFGTFALYMHNNVLPYFYFLFAVCVIIAHTYLYCTRCVYYGRDCYISGGRIAKRYFPKKTAGPAEQDDAMVASLWLLLAMMPVPFLLYYQDLVLAILVVGFFWIWFIVHKQTACMVCETKWCGLCAKKGGK
jgi:hypothetical protein